MAGVERFECELVGPMALQLMAESIAAIPDAITRHNCFEEMPAPVKARLVERLLQTSVFSWEAYTALPSKHRAIVAHAAGSDDIAAGCEQLLALDAAPTTPRFYLYELSRIKTERRRKGTLRSFCHKCSTDTDWRVVCTNTGPDTVVAGLARFRVSCERCAKSRSDNDDLLEALAAVKEAQAKLQASIAVLETIV